MKRFNLLDGVRCANEPICLHSRLPVTVISALRSGNRCSICFSSDKGSFIECEGKKFQFRKVNTGKDSLLQIVRKEENSMHGVHRVSSKLLVDPFEASALLDQSQKKRIINHQTEIIAKRRKKKQPQTNPQPLTTTDEKSNIDPSSFPWYRKFSFMDHPANEFRETEILPVHNPSPVPHITNGNDYVKWTNVFQKKYPEYVEVARRINDVEDQFRTAEGFFSELEKRIGKYKGNIEGLAIKKYIEVEQKKLEKYKKCVDSEMSWLRMQHSFLHEELKQIKERVSVFVKENPKLFAK